MNKYPSDWRSETFGSICEKIMDGTHFSPKTKSGSRLYLTSKNIKNGKIDLSDVSCISEDEHREIYSRCDAKKGDILLTKDGANTGNAAINSLDEEFSLLSSVAVIRPNIKHCDTGYAFQWLISDSFQALLKSRMAGNAISRLTLQKINDLPIAIPPLPEQKKIAEILSGVDTTIAKLKLQAQKLDALRFFLAEELAEVLHSEGELSALQDIAEIRTGIAKNSNSEGDLVELPYMRVANVQDGYLDLSEIKTISVDRGRIARYLLQKGDVLINEGGDLDKVGRGVIWHEEIRECLHQNHVFAVRCSQRLMPEFLSLLLKTTHSKNYFLGCAKQTTNLASINSAQLKSFPIPLPSLDAQNEFINHITSIKQLTSSVSRKISSLAAMKNAISSDLLSGRKRVTL